MEGISPDLRKAEGGPEPHRLRLSSVSKSTLASAACSLAISGGRPFGSTGNERELDKEAFNVLGTNSTGLPFCTGFLSGNGPRFHSSDLRSPRASRKAAI